MRARLGNILYWVGCAIAVLFVMTSIIVAMKAGSEAELWLAVYLIGATVVWLIGRVAKYALAGK